MKKQITEAIELLKNVTPLAVDCGLLCDKACCGDSCLEEALYDEAECSESGMLLFPGEEQLYETVEWGHLVNTEYILSNGRVIKLFVCDDDCPRELRPLACMVFPLFAEINEGKAIVVNDARARGVCPLSLFAPNEEFQNEFVDAVQKAFEVLATDDECSEFIDMINDEFQYFI